MEVKSLKDNIEAALEKLAIKNVIGSKNVLLGACRREFAVIINKPKKFELLLIATENDGTFCCFKVRQSEYYADIETKMFYLIEMIVSTNLEDRCALFRNDLSIQSFLRKEELPKDAAELPGKYLTIGDIILVNRGKYKHAAIYVGNGEVMHVSGVGTSPKEGEGFFAEKSGATPRIGRYKEEFVGDNCLKIERIYSLMPLRTPDQIVNCAHNLLSQDYKQYHLIWSNCEHFASYCVFGAEFSEQIERYIRLGKFALGTIAMMGTMGVVGFAVAGPIGALIATTANTVGAIIYKKFL